MGLGSGGGGQRRPVGLALLAKRSAEAEPRSHAIQSLSIRHLESNLNAAVAWVVHGASLDAPAAAPLARDGLIDFRAVEQHVQLALQVATGWAAAQQPAQAGAALDAGTQSGAATSAADEPSSASGTVGGLDGAAASSSSSQRAGGDADGARARSAASSRGGPPLLERGFPPDSPAAAQAPVARPPTPAAASGRLGPDEVALVEARGTCFVADVPGGIEATSRANFSTLRSNVCVWKGRWMFEVQLATSGIMQLGWTTLQARFNNEQGVGDNQDSYAYDGRRKMRWHGSNAPYGQQWSAGDVISCMADLDAGTMRFARNGVDLGEAFSNVRRGMPGVAYFAGVSLSYGESCHVNFGARPFLHHAEGYQPLQQHIAQPVPGLPAPPGVAPLEARRGQLAAARYLAACLSRLIDVSTPALAEATTDEESSPSESDAGSEQEEAEQQQQQQPEPQPQLGQQAAQPPVAAHVLAASGRLLPDADMLAALAAAAGDPGSSKGAAGVAPSSPAAELAGGDAPAPGPAIGVDERVLLGAVLAQRLGPLCHDAYVVEAVLLELLDEAAGDLAPASGGANGGEAAAARGAELGRRRLAQLLQLLAAVLDPDELAALAAACCQVLAARVRGSVWALGDMPASRALSALRLWDAMLECEAVRAAWLASDGWHRQLVELMVVRQPSHDDLVELLRNLKVTWRDGGTAVVRNRRKDQSLFATDLGRLTAGFEAVEAAQADLLLRLWLQPGGGGGGAPAPAGGHVRGFLSYLVARNHQAEMHIPPPDLASPTALVSVVFALLRLMNEQVSARLPEVPELRWVPAATFLQGPNLPGGGADPYFDFGRLGGTLSHLAREHPPTDEERRPLEGLPLGAVVKYESPLRLGAHVLEGPSFDDVWLRDRLLVLCHLSAAPLMRGSLSHLSAMQAAMVGLRTVNASVEEGGPSRMLDQTRRECQREFVHSLRLHEWAQCWLLTPWRQQAAFVLSVATAQLLAAVSAQRGGLLRYVPELYVSTLLDMVHAVHRCEPAVLDHKAMLGLGLRHVLEFVVSHLEDGRIVNPEVQTRLVHMVLEGVQELDLLCELGANAVARRRLLPAMMRLFGRPHLWGQSSNFFALLTEGCGLLHPPPAFPPDFRAPVAKLRGLFGDACLADPELVAQFLHNLFDHANRMLTELVASLESLDGTLGRPGAGQPSSQLLRLLSSTADYALVLLRTLELMAAKMPQLFLEGGSMNLQRVGEVLGFAVPQLVSGRASQALRRVAANRLVAQQLRLRSAHLLQPLAGVLVALWEAEQRQPEGRRPLLRTLCRQPALTDEVLQALQRAPLADVEPLSAEAAAAAAAAAEGSPAADEELQQRLARDQQRLSSTLSALLAGRRAAAAAAAGGPGAAGGGGDEAAGGQDEAAEPPDEFLDPILATLMLDPVLLPDSRVTVDRATIERHLLSSATDPFSRAPLTKAQLQPDASLRQRIQAWVAAHPHHAHAHHA